MINTSLLSVRFVAANFGRLGEMDRSKVCSDARVRKIGLNEDPERGCRDRHGVVKGTAVNFAAGSAFPWRDVACRDLV